MRWNSRYYLKDREGETRVVRKFLFWPRLLQKDKHWRWLEFANIKEQVLKVDIGGSGEWGTYAWEWREVAFVEDENNEVE
jgi:hypothetical protein